MSVHIYAENFRSYPKIDWTIPSGLTLLDGINMDSGGSNMAGKTTLCDAWAWCRYGWLPKWDGPKGGSADAVIRRPFKNCLVRVTETIGPDTIEITRERPHRLIVKKNGTEIKGADQNALDQILGMNAARFLICVYISQKRRRSFFSMGDTERTEMLSIISGLEDLDRALSEAKTARVEKENSIGQYAGGIQILESQLSGIPRKLKQVKEEKEKYEKEHEAAVSNHVLVCSRYEDQCPKIEVEEKEAIEEKIQSLLDEMTQVRYQMCESRGKCNGINQKLQSCPVIEPEYLEKVESKKKELDKAKREAKKLEEIKYFNQRTDEKIQAIFQSQDEMKNGKCSECNRPLDEEEIIKHLQDSIDQIKKLEALKQPLIEVPDIEKIEKEYSEAKLALQKRQIEIDEEPNKLRQQFKVFDAQNKQQLAEQRNLEQKIEALQKACDQKIADRKRVLFQETKDSESTLMSIARLMKSAEENIKNVIVMEKEIRESLESQKKKVKELQTELEETADLIELFGPRGYRSICYDGLVNRISDRAGQLLGVMTDGLYSTYLKQLAQDSKGNQKLVLKPVLVRGGKDVSLDDLSGGGEDRAALAYDVAVSEVAGDGLPLLMDEALTALDVIGKTEAMRLLEEVAKSRPVLVIDHSSEFKAMFNNVVRIIYQSEESHLEVA